MPRTNPLQSQSPAPQWQAVSRVVYPVLDQDLTMPLYAIEWTRPHMGEGTLDPHKDFVSLDFAQMTKTEFRSLLEDTAHAQPADGAHNVFRVNGRASLTVLAGRHASLCTFFNAFPAGYWRRWTSVDTVRFSARVRGRGTIMLFRSSGRGLFEPAGTIDVHTPTRATTVHADLAMTGLMDGGFFWFDAKAGDSDDLTIEDAAWSVPVEARCGGDGTLSIAITTFNRAPYCLNQLRAIAADANVRGRLDTIYCTDQGTDLVRDEPGFATVAKDLGSQLTYLRQRNMGGSGGFARGMYETVKAGKSDYTLLLDDDAISEPESIMRAVQFADYCTRPTIVGGGMFHLDNRTMLYTLGERYNRASYWTQPAAGLEYNHDFATQPLRDSPKLHRRADSDFNGWWMCLIPTQIMREIGLAQPLFIKFDDVDYGLRAEDHGYHTVCLPGVAVWHQAWHAKDPSRTWEGYYLYRNHWICSLLHCTKPSWHFLYGMLFDDAKAGVELVYSAMHLHHLALRDIMRGPDYIADTLATKLGDVRKAREGFPDSATTRNRDDFPTPKAEYIANMKPRPSMIDVRLQAMKTIAKAFVSRGNGMRDTQPDLLIPSRDASWPAYASVNSAVVTSPDGDSVAWLRRDSKLYRQQTMRGLFLAKELLKRWESLAKEYQNSDMASFEAWAKVFEDPANQLQ
ncbi:glycosyltransferase [Bifidobacterium pseudolongum]|uniref:Glycosyl transferase family 2 n=2 Tax=Bifidobacterium pseudolongum TaxID=1694 RepID=A0A0A7I9D7_9BIFI|nr:glycosyltransferase [Bifidobacterium pseudolongum]AIZ16862.1 glycosyl transferase family 2 [Bifidobacterium pseudolongum PV8-2]PKU98950.1 glycosyl transferase family 2 [Bifidobacterium pseudolongum subsp. globosum]RYQ65996.1 glycosyl transferase family 2 [Bifidobacterium pseudolongum subsp. globosum]RYQ69358.1 glycosyl transferase family 2 [Bifidobacterium pseudolongum subsp. globosum]RYQ71326.1 glycosyl transferase family 2 [Bifidobacterium pseudolongum subsp. globosum]